MNNSKYTVVFDDCECWDTETTCECQNEAKMETVTGKTAYYQNCQDVMGNWVAVVKDTKGIFELRNKGRLIGDRQVFEELVKRQTA